MSDVIEYGYCSCGCGLKTKIPTRSDSQKGWEKGMPLHFVKGHNLRLLKGESHSSWKGGKHINSDGYVLVRSVSHPKASKYGNFVYEHILVAEKMFGGSLPVGYVVHHINEIKSDNRAENLFICKSRKEHIELHSKIKAIAECGNATWRKCNYCHKWDSPANLIIHGSKHARHKDCYNGYRRLKWAEKHKGG